MRLHCIPRLAWPASVAELGFVRQHSPLPSSMKLIAPAVVLLHLALVVLCFGAAICQPERCGLWPRCLLTADYPASLAAVEVCGLVHDLGGVHSYTSGLVADAVVFAVVGSVWWFLLGWVVVRVVRTFATRAA